MSGNRLVGGACAVGIIALAGYFFIQSKQAEKELNSLQEIATTEPVKKERIWIDADECKTTFGANTIAFCNGVSKDDSLFLDTGADAAVKACFEYTAKKIGQSASDAIEIACSVKQAYQDRDYEFDEATQTFGIQNSNYNILNDWVNR